MKKRIDKNLIALGLFILFFGFEILFYFKNKQKYLRYQENSNTINHIKILETNIDNIEKDDKEKEVEKEQNRKKVEAEKMLSVIKDKNFLKKEFVIEEKIFRNEDDEKNKEKKKEITRSIKKVGEVADLSSIQNEISFIGNDNVDIDVGDIAVKKQEIDKWIEKSEYVFGKAIKQELLDNDTNEYVEKIKNLVEEAKRGEALYDFNIEQDVKDDIEGVFFYGDSNVKHFEYYNMLSYKYYGYLVSKIENQIKDIEIHIKKRKPKKIVFFNGYNIAYYKNGDEYVEEYKKIIQKIKEIDENIKIYICSLLPAKEEVKIDDLHKEFPHNIYRGEEFDKALENYFIGQERGATYINTKWIIKDDYYGKDGVHMKKPFYKVFVRYIAYLLKII